VTDPKSDSTPDETGKPAKPVEKRANPVFTKAPQPDLPLADRRKKAGLTLNRVGIWVVVGGFALYLIITGIIGIITKAR
jgi:hypothetical protein